MSAIRRYLAEIGRRGGLKSRRTLDADTARAMVRVREARRAYRRFHATCFPSSAPERRVTAVDIPWIAEQLRRHGNRDARRVADRLCPSAGHALGGSRAMEDTSADAHATQAMVLRGLDGIARLRLALDLSDTMRSLALRRLRTQHPQARHRDLVMRLLRLAYPTCGLPPGP